MKAPQPPVRRLQWVDSKGYLTEYGQATLREQAELALAAYDEAITARLAGLEVALQAFQDEIDAVEAVAQSGLTTAREGLQAVDALRGDMIRADADWRADVARLQETLEISTAQRVDLSVIQARLADVETMAGSAMLKAQQAFDAAMPEAIANQFADMNVVFNAVAVRNYFVSGPAATVNLTASAIEAQAYTAKGAVVLPNTNFFTEADVK